MASPPGPISVPLSALEHYGYCPRQAALIHVDGYFDSSTDTVRGDLAHAAVDRAGPEQDRHGHHVWHALPVWSDQFALHGICDTVELPADGPVPIEHKSGTYRPGGPADLQVAGQVLCLREMFSAPVPIGIVFAGRHRRRHVVQVDHELVNRVVQAVAALQTLLVEGVLPPAVNDNRCQRCSLRPGCEPSMPTMVAGTLFRPRPADLTLDGDSS
jgi:CRISPR-associated exonuclease Cas4